jgi:hypothetical protein
MSTGALIRWDPEIGTSNYGHFSHHHQSMGLSGPFCNSVPGRPAGHLSGMRIGVRARQPRPWSMALHAEGLGPPIDLRSGGTVSALFHRSTGFTGGLSTNRLLRLLPGFNSYPASRRRIPPLDHVCPTRSDQHRPSRGAGIAERPLLSSPTSG